MPTLQFKGRNVIWNHHLSVPYHTLEEVKDLNVAPKKADGNLLIEGDNLIALKALLPQYTGKIDCIYIDPPYNTGEEKWVYNDNVNNPMIKEWIGKVVAKDDLTRHDKWLCMMVPRLKILRDLLSDRGSIFVSIDDNEVADLKAIMDDIFVEANYRNMIVIRRGIKSVQAQFDTVDRLNYGVEYVLVYSKQEKFKFNRFEIELENGKGGGWNNHWRGTDRPTMRYEIFGIKPDTGQWRWGEARSKIAIENYQELLNDIGNEEQEITQEEIDKWWKKYVEDNGEEIDFLRLSSTGKPEHYVPPSDSKLASSLWSDLKPNGSSQLKRIFGKKVFNNPKSVDLIKRIVRFSEGEKRDSIVLDSFAGSGTTGEAVLDLNKEDEGNRKFILVQMTEATPDEPAKNICKDIARERVKRAIVKYEYDAGFKYFRVGIPLDPESILSGKLPTFEQLAKYVFYLCTGENLQDEKTIAEKEYFVGHHGHLAVHLIYKQDFQQLTRLALNLELAEKFRKAHPKKRLVVYAPACFLGEEDLEEMQIDFVSIPYNLFQRNG